MSAKILVFVNFRLKACEKALTSGCDRGLFRGLAGNLERVKISETSGTTAASTVSRDPRVIAGTPSRHPRGCGSGGVVDAVGQRQRLIIHCQTTSVSAAHATHCATYCTPCRPLIRAFSGWILTPPPTRRRSEDTLPRGCRVEAGGSRVQEVPQESRPDHNPPAKATPCLSWTVCLHVVWGHRYSPGVGV